jgi:hypothetical protein
MAVVDKLQGPQTRRNRVVDSPVCLEEMLIPHILNKEQCDWLRETESKSGFLCPYLHEA